MLLLLIIKICRVASESNLFLGEETVALRVANVVAVDGKVGLSDHHHGVYLLGRARIRENLLGDRLIDALVHGQLDWCPRSSVYHLDVMATVCRGLFGFAVAPPDILVDEVVSFFDLCLVDFEVLMRAHG